MRVRQKIEAKELEKEGRPEISPLRTVNVKAGPKNARILLILHTMGHATFSKVVLELLSERDFFGFFAFAGFHKIRLHFLHLTGRVPLP